MIQIEDFQAAMAQNFFNGDLGLAGMALYTGVMALIFVVLGKKSLTVPFAVMLPTTVIFTSMGILPESLTVLLIIVAVIGLGVAVKDKVA